jgi:methionyl-tRNA formyltransferase
VKILFFGSSEFSVPFLKEISQSGHKVVLVLTKPDMRQGRGKKLLPNPVKEFSSKTGLEYIESAGFDKAVNDAISGISFDFLVVVSFGKIITDNILEIAGERTINVHPSLLPKYRGPSPISTAIMNGDNSTGITFTKIREKFDTGDIYMVIKFSISPDDNKDSLEEKIIKISAPVLVSLLDILEKHNIKTVPQSKYGTSYTRIFSKSDFRIDWSLKPRQILNKIRAFSSEPGSFTTWNGKLIKILAAKIPAANKKLLKSCRNAKCGQVLQADSDGLIIKCMETQISGANCKNSLLHITELKPEGKNRMGYADFINGYRIKPGEIFE